MPDKQTLIDLASKEQANILKHRYPNVPLDTIINDIHNIIELNIKDIDSIVSNSVKYYQSPLSSLQVMNTLLNTTNCIAGNGCVYANHDNEDSPRTKWLSSKLSNRKVYKKKQFESKENSPEYNYYKLLQMLEKLLANAEYGAVGSKYSSLYFQEGGSSTTLSGRIVVSSAACMFEQVLIPGNYKFDSFTDLMKFIYDCISNISSDYQFSLLRSIDDVIRKFQLKSSFEFTDNQIEILRTYLQSLNEYELTMIYYKWNLYDFLEEPFILTKLKEILHILQSEIFLNPYEVPSSIQFQAKAITQAIFDCVYLQGYSTHDRIVKFATMQRGVVIGADTDSNMIYTKATSNRIFELCNWSKPTENDYISFTNFQASFLAPILADVFYSLSKSMNIPQRYLKQFAMKNEFLWTRIVLTLVKKRYVVKTIVQEGHLLEQPRTSITGHDFYKSGCPKSASKIFKDIINDCFLGKGEIDLLGAIKRIDKLSEDIRQSLLDGTTEYLPRVAIRPPNGLQFPWRHEGYRGTYFWNLLNPMDSVSLIGKGALLYLTIYTLDDVPKNHHMYEAIKNNVFLNQDIPDQEKNSKKLSSICIPDSYGKIPSWCTDFIDFNRIIDRVTSFFASVLEPFNVLYQRHGTSKTTYTKAPTRLIQF